MPERVSVEDNTLFLKLFRYSGFMPNAFMDK